MSSYPNPYANAAGNTKSPFCSTPYYKYPTSLTDSLSYPHPTTPTTLANAAKQTTLPKCYSDSFSSSREPIHTYSDKQTPSSTSYCENIGFPLEPSTHTYSDKQTTSSRSYCENISSSYRYQHQEEEELTEGIYDKENQRITKVPDEIWMNPKYRQVETVLLNQNYLTTFPTNMKVLTQVKHLYLARNLFTELPIVVLKFTSLKVLNLENNKLTHLPANMSMLQSLTELNVSYNQLSALPESLRNCEQLVILRASNNNIEQFPHQLCTWKLRKLVLQNNQLKVPPQNICQKENCLSDVQRYYSQNEKQQRSLQDLSNLKVDEHQSDAKGSDHERHRVDLDGDPKLQQDVDAFPFEDPPTEEVQPQRPEVQAHQRELNTATMQDVTNPPTRTKRSTSQGDSYVMNRRPRGEAIIINNVKFMEPGRERKGSDVDAERLYHLFTNLHFRVHEYTNLGAEEMTLVLKAFSKESHKRFDCLVVCILSHGALGKVYGIDNRDVEIKELTKLFTSPWCPTLAGKPKLFFIQACQGTTNMTGVETDGDDEIRSLIPSEADFLLGYSTVPGYVSYRDENNGSFYISKLVDVMEQYSDEEHLLDMMTRVNEAVSNMVVDMIYTTVPAPTYTLRSKVWFK
ncbi:uncharacterized protein LOC100369664 [Saccoglossus kowalevskii]|uniref:Caspase-8-like isoform X1 n=1 Tax=Saccoglossus kowalevskii TaxID=10224 RepID=A0ABM0M7M3_SACKO|nr:PREDICTED: caspase-8-like isoform X1 [Saccoglossus kowalevskii]XP_006816014.1 PREDICTED: caspase-8-like isoform X2 [Saccoglossus kowalevskii]XP_006816015.1 PREDICTED: caspase-8-like isoform X3 [Saccoglossus kowalevskii]